MKLTTLLALVPLVFMAACDETAPGVDGEQAKQTEVALAEADRQVGYPNIINFTERKLAKAILELRDSEGLATWTYIVDMHGELHFLTQSIGYGLPYSIQFTNPEKVVHECYANGGSFGTLPQADPNGLFMPDGLSATWILASTEAGPKPLYVEPEIIVSPFPLHENE